MEEYEFEPHVYIKNDLEESDSETRRRHCMKFVMNLARKFQNETSELIGKVIEQLNSEYESDKAEQW